MPILMILRVVSETVRPLVYPLMVGAGSCLIAVAMGTPGRSPAGVPPMAEIEAEATKLDHLQRAVAARTAHKDALVGDLIDGRAPLAVVAAEFAGLAEADPRQAEMIARAFPGRTPEETAARNAICFAENRLEGRPDKGEVRARLAREFADGYGAALAR